MDMNNTNTSQSSAPASAPAPAAQPSSSPPSVSVRLSSLEPKAPIGDPAKGLNDLLDQLKNKFTSVSEDMLSKMDDMSRRLDALEAQLRVDGTQTESKN